MNQITNKLKALLLMMALICTSAAFGADSVTLSTEVAGGGKLTPGEQAQINIYITTPQTVEIYGLDFTIKSSDFTLVNSTGTKVQATASSEFSEMTMANSINTGRFMFFSMTQTPVIVNGKTLVCTVTINVNESVTDPATVTLDPCYYTSDKDGMNTPVIGPFSSTLAVNPPTPKSISVTAPGNKTEYQSYDKVQLTAAVTPAAADQSVTWTCSDTRYAEIDNAGLVTVKAVGVGNQPVVTFTATSTADTSVSGSIDLTFKPILPIGITINSTGADMIIGDTKTFTVTIQPDNAESKDFNAVILNESVARITDQNISNGTITVSALQAGSTTLKVTCNHNSTLVTEIPIKVSPRLVTKIEITGPSALTKGEKGKYTAVVTPDNATNTAVTWQSSQPGVAAINSSTGEVTAVATGVTQITAKAVDGSNIVSNTISLTVTGIPVTSVTLDKTSATIKDSETISLKATVLPENADNKAINWSSSNTQVATVASDGTVSPVAPGQCDITAASASNPDVKAVCRLTVTETPVTSIDITPNATQTLKVGGTVQFKYTINPSNATVKTAQWENSDATVGTITQAGLFTAKAIGTTKIKATAGGVSSTEITVNVTPTLVSGITLSPQTATLKAGEKVTITATVAPADATDKTLTWTTSDAAIATVDANGVVTAVKVGEATITATAKDGSGVKATAKITVAPTLVSKITISGPAATLRIGNTMQLTAAVTPDDATDKTVTWTSSNTSVATVDAKTGLVTAVNNNDNVGKTVTITATANDASKTSAQYQIRIIAIPATGVTIATPAKTKLMDGESVTLTATVTPANASDKTVAWSSSDATVATVDANGVVTAKAKLGKVTITATANGSEETGTVKATVELEVIATPVSKIEVSADKTSIEAGQTAKFTATVTPDNATDKAVAWSSSDATVATVDANGVVTGVKVGTTTITATAKDGSGVKGSATITVVPTLWKSLSVDVKSYSIVKGENFTAQVTGTPSNVTDKTLNVTSSNAAVATATYDPATGKVTVTGTGEGTAIITVATKDGSDLSARINVTVADKLVISATDGNGAVVNEVPLYNTLTLTVNTDNKVTWNLTNGFTLISENGSSVVVKAAATGVFTVSATTAGNITSAIQLTVTEPSFVNATDIKLNFTDVTLSFPKGMIQLVATVIPAECTNDPVTWSSDNTSVATVDADGFVTATGLGMTYIFVTSVNADGSEVRSFCKVTVIEASGIEAAAAGEPVITLTPMTINVSGVADDCKVSVYTLTGQLIASETGCCSVSVANRGVYIVKVGNKALKVSVTR